MQTTISNQITSIQRVKTFSETVVGLLNNQDLVGVNRFILAANTELSEELAPLNDAGATLAALNIAKRAFEDAHNIILSPFHSGYTPGSIMILLCICLSFLATILSRIILLEPGPTKRERSQTQEDPGAVSR